MAEKIKIQQIGGLWIAVVHGIVLCMRPNLPEVMKQAVWSAGRTAKLGLAVEVVVEDAKGTYTVWHSDRDGFVDDRDES